MPRLLQTPSEEDKHSVLQSSRIQIVAVIVILLASWVMAQMALDQSLTQVRTGIGFDAERSNRLYRFDSQYYREIAESGYSYNGDPFSSPTIVFFPLFPMQTALVQHISGIELIDAGFLVVHLNFVIGAILIFLIMRKWFGARAAFFVIIGLCFSPGTFAFHAFYSESTTLCLLGVLLVMLDRRWDFGAAATCLVMSASRTTAAPWCSLVALLLALRGLQAYRNKRPLGEIVRPVVYSPLCLTGLAIFLIYIWTQFGNPFVLIPKIQTASWGKFHKEIAIWELLTLKHMFVYILQAFQRPEAIRNDIQTINLIWTILAIISAFYAALRFKRPFMKYGFALYLLLIYYANAGSPYLISNHRHLTMMLPIYLMFGDACRNLSKRFGVWAGIVLAAIGIGFSAYLYWHCTMRFSMGWAYFF